MLQFITIWTITLDKYDNDKKLRLSLLSLSLVKTFVVFSKKKKGKSNVAHMKSEKRIDGSLIEERHNCHAFHPRILRTGGTGDGGEV